MEFPTVSSCCFSFLTRRAQPNEFPLPQTPELNKREMWIYPNQGGLIPGLLPHLVCNWPCCCKDDAEGLEDCWRLSYIHPAWQGLWGKSASKTSQRGLQSGICLLSFSISFSLFLVESLFVMNKNIAWHLPDAQSVRGRRWGDMIEILVKRQEVIWTGARRREGMVSVCSCLHSRWDLFKMRPLTTRLTLSLSPCEYLSTDLQLTDIAAYVKSARAIILISPHKHKTSVLLSPVKPTDHLCEKLYSWQQRASFVCRNSKSVWLWSYHGDVFLLRKDNAPALNPNWDPSAFCTQEINKMWWNKWGNSICISKHCSTQHSKSCKINRLKSKEKEAFFFSQETSNVCSRIYFLCHQKEQTCHLSFPR